MIAALRSFDPDLLQLEEAGRVTLVAVLAYGDL